MTGDGLLTTDAARVRDAARTVGVWVAVASALVIAAGVGILILVIVLSSRAESLREEIPGRGGGDELVVDVDAVVPWVLALGLVGVALLAFVAWFAARRSVAPLAEALRLQRNFVADASHELRTPLTTLSSRVQILQRRRARDEPIDDTVAELRRDIDAMADMLTDLLLAAEGDLGASVEGGHVTDAVRNAVIAIQPLADDAVVRVSNDGEPGLVTLMPTVTLTRVLVALLDNAVQHAPAGGNVGVVATAGPTGVEIRVHDDGPGIRGIDPESVFERFARTEERGRRRGFGLGLALVREAAARYGGSVVVERTSPSGTTFLLRIPRSGPGITRS